jgi:hypothetical protein
MYIRAMAVFDLLAMLLATSAGLRNSQMVTVTAQRIGGRALVWYQAHIELTLLNTLLSASMYSAVVLTVERYIMLCHPMKHLQTRRTKAQARRQVRLNICIIVLLAGVLHAPLSVQFVDKVNDEYFTTNDTANTAQYSIVDNEMLSDDIWKTVSVLAHSLYTRTHAGVHVLQGWPRNGTIYGRAHTCRTQRDHHSWHAQLL